MKAIDTYITLKTPPNSFEYSRVIFYMANAHATNKDWSQASHYYYECLNNLKALYKNTNVYTGGCYFNLGTSEFENG